jgi:hypothetical protein
MAAAGDPAAANIDHEVIGPSVSIQEGKNLVINMIGLRRRGAGWAVW